MKKIWYILLLLLVVGAGCKDDWDNYYGEEEDDRSAGAKVSLLEALQLKPRYSKFVQLLKETGLDKQVGSERVLTLWVPTDNYLTEEIMSLDSINKRRFVLNHMNTLALYKTKLATKYEIETLAGKYVQISGLGNNTTIEKLKITQFDQVCSNGVIHEIAGVMMPLKNVMEYLLECGEDFSIYRDSLLAYNDTVFRPDLSYAIGVNEVGQTLYDSVFDITNSLLRNVDFADEKFSSTLFLPSNEVIEDMIGELNTFYSGLGLQATHADTLAAYDFIIKASFLGSELTNLSGRKYIYTSGGKTLRLDKQLISTNYDKCSNGVVYRYEKAYVPRGQFMKKVDFVVPSLFELPEEQWSEYYQLSSGGTLNNNKTGDAGDFKSNLFADSKQPNDHFLSVKAEKGEWVELTILQKTLAGKIEPAKLMPGKYQLKAWGYSWDAANVKVYVDGKSQLYSAKGLDAYRNGLVIPMGQRSQAFGMEAGLQIMCDTVEIGIHPNHNVIRLESAGSGQMKNSIKVREILFEPVGENY